MMNGYGPGWAWMILMPLLTIAIIGLIIWAVIRLAPGSSFGPGAPGQQGRETPQEILDRRFARGEINAEEYQQARAHLAGREPGRS